MPLRNTNTKTVGGSKRSAVEVLLAENVDNLGERGEIVRVKPGYARNYLLPYGLATVATEENKQNVELHKQRLKEVEKKQIQLFKERADAIRKYSVTLEANANDDGHLYGSIVAVDIAKALSSAGYDVTAEQIKLEGPLKELGMYTVKIELHSQVKTEVKVWVVPAAG